jgi:hypothetical protein
MTTVYTKDTAEYVSLTVTRLQTLLGTGEDAETVLPWVVSPFYGTSHDQLWELLPGVLTAAQGMPVAVVLYTGSDYDKHPRRTARISVLLIAETPNEVAGRAIVAPLLDRLLDLLEYHIDGQAKWEAASDEALDLGANLSCLKIEFKILDA